MQWGKPGNRLLDFILHLEDEIIYAFHDLKNPPQSRGRCFLIDLIRQSASHLFKLIPNDPLCDCIDE